MVHKLKGYKQKCRIFKIKLISSKFKRRVDSIMKLTYFWKLRD